MRTVIPLAAIAAVLAFASTAQAAKPAEAGSFVLTANSPGGTYAPTFTGNGMLGVRVPPTGQGYAGGTVPAQSELAGFYARPRATPSPRTTSSSGRTSRPGRRSPSPTAARRSRLPGTGVSRWRQSIDLHTGIVTTTATLDRAGRARHRPHLPGADRPRDRRVGLVRLEFTPQWSGTATVTDVIDGTAGRPPALS